MLDRNFFLLWKSSHFNKFIVAKVSSMFQIFCRLIQGILFLFCLSFSQLVLFGFLLKMVYPMSNILPLPRFTIIQLLCYKVVPLLNFRHGVIVLLVWRSSSLHDILSSNVGLNSHILAVWDCTLPGIFFTWVISQVSVGFIRILLQSLEVRINYIELFFI